MIGVDFGSRFIKLCWSRGADSDTGILGAALIPAGSQRTGASSAGGLVRGFLRSSGWISEKAITSLGSARVSARNFTFPLLEQEELAGAVRIEAEQSSATDLSLLDCDFRVLSRAGNKELDILFVAAPRENVGQYVGLVRDAGLSLAGIDIDSLAAARCYCAFEPAALRETVVLINIGHTNTQLAVVDSGVLRFVRHIAFGGQQISEEIARVYGIPAEMAEGLKQRPQTWPEIGLNIKNILRRTVPDLLEAVYRSIDYCISRKKILNVDRIVLTGGTALLRGIDGFFSEVLGIPVVRWNPLENLRIPGRVRKDQGYFLTVVLGLCINEQRPHT